MEASPATHPPSDTPAPATMLPALSSPDLSHLNNVARQNLPSFEDALRILVGDNTPPEVLAHAFAVLTAEQHTTVTGLHRQGQRAADLTFRAQVAINNGGIHQQALYNLFKAYGYEVRLPSLWTRFCLWRKRREAARKADEIEKLHQTRMSFFATTFAERNSDINRSLIDHANILAEKFNNTLLSMSPSEIERLPERFRTPLSLLRIQRG